MITRRKKKRKEKVLIKSSARVIICSNNGVNAMIGIEILHFSNQHNDTSLKKRSCYFSTLKKPRKEQNQAMMTDA
jgi:hypothetical protein